MKDFPVQILTPELFSLSLFSFLFYPFCPFSLLFHCQFPFKDKKAYCMHFVLRAYQLTLIKYFIVPDKVPISIKKVPYST